MLKHVSHLTGLSDTSEILYATPFGYMFPELAESPACRLPEGQDTVRALIRLGEVMASDDGVDANSAIPSFFTYFGQFIDHDLTARTDREGEVSEIFNSGGGAAGTRPVAPAAVVAGLRNGRRPQFDLDSVYGDGPAFSDGPGAVTTSDALYDNYRFRLQSLDGGLIDLPRLRPAETDLLSNPRQALIGDQRNDENTNISQLHAAILAFHNAVMDGLAADGTTGLQAFIQARQLVRWVYQRIVVEEYLKTVCMPDIVEEVLRGGPAFYGPIAGGMPLFMPLEFSVAVFRMGHSMIRPSYQLRGTEATIQQILGLAAAKRPDDPTDTTKPPRTLEDPLEPASGSAENAYRLKVGFTVDWAHFIGPNATNKARRLDPFIARGLTQLTFERLQGTLMAQLATRNLLRAYSLSLPTGQAVAAAMGIVPLTAAELAGSHEGLRGVFGSSPLGSRTPLWFYVLREAELQGDGEHLGVVGSRILAETMVGLLWKDPTSYLMSYGKGRSIRKEGIAVPRAGGRVLVGSFADLLAFAGLHGDPASLTPDPDRDRQGQPVQSAG